MSGDLSEDVLKALEKADLAVIDIKPEEDPKHYLAVAHLSAAKADPDQISLMLGITAQEVKDILGLERIQALVRQIHQKQFARDPQGHIRSLLPKALEVQEEMLKPGVKDELRFKAAESIMDRALGKAPQVMNIQSSSIALLFDRLDRLVAEKRMKTIEAEHKKMDNETEEAEIVEAAKRSNPFQKWVDENT